MLRARHQIDVSASMALLDTAEAGYDEPPNRHGLPEWRYTIVGVSVQLGLGAYRVRLSAFLRAPELEPPRRPTLWWTRVPSIAGPWVHVGLRLLAFTEAYCITDDAEPPDTAPPKR